MEINGPKREYLIKKLATAESNARYWKNRFEIANACRNKLEEGVAQNYSDFCKNLAIDVRNGKRFPARGSIEGIAEWLENITFDL